jgi:glycosyltransferase involved in cell wall biosynthesis
VIQDLKKVVLQKAVRSIIDLSNNQAETLEKSCQKSNFWRCLMDNYQPRISIGMPVHNGDNFIREALDAILAQTFREFELIITDNASTDKTETICREYAAQDSRIRYYRHQSNQGAARNFNHAFELSSGEYFKWAAHDDICTPEFLERCVEVLDRDPTVVLCHTKTRGIDGQGNTAHDYETKRQADSVKPEERFLALIHERRCFQIFGLIRTDILRKTSLMGNYAHGDGVLLVQLGLQGRFYEVPEYLFLYRHHSEQSIAIARAKSHQKWQWYTEWFDSGKRGKLALPWWRVFCEYGTAISIRKTPLRWQERMRCTRHLLGWLRVRRHSLQQDLVMAIQAGFKG